MSIQILTVNESLVVDSRLIADELGITHKGFLQTIKKYLTEIEQFGTLEFKMREFKTSQGNTSTEIYCYLNEDQATYTMTLSRNSEQVRQCKRNLVRAFSEAKKLIKEVIPQQSDRIRELELQNEVLSKQLELRQLDHTMLVLHGKETVLALRGMADQIVETEKVVLEVIDQRCGDRRKGMTTAQLKDHIKKMTGVTFKSGAELERRLQKIAPDLLDLIQRPITQSFVHQENIDKAVRILSEGQRQLLLGE
jgi:phage regulator Rha-like protein